MEAMPALILFVFTAGITPGPNNIMIMASGLNFGIRASLPHFLGICFGFPTMFFAMGFGLGYMFEAYPLLHEFIKVLGIAYLLYLAWLIAHAAPDSNSNARAKPFTFFQATLFQWVNPKAWIMGTSAIATFTTTDATMYQQILIIGAVFFLSTFPCAGSWLFLGRFLQDVIGNARQQRIFNVVMATLLTASIAPIAANLVKKYLG